MAFLTAIGASALVGHHKEDVLPDPALSHPLTQGTELALLLFGSSIIVIGFAMIVWGLRAQPKDPNRRLVFGITRLCVAVGLIGASGHAFLTAPEQPWQPNFDTTTLWWALVAVFGLVLPIFDEIGLGDFRFKVAREGVDVVNDAAGLMQAWAKTTNRFLANIANAKTSKEALGLALDFVSLRAYEAIEWVGKDGEERRAAVWLYNSRDDALVFFLSNEIRDDATINARIPVSQGVAGAAFRDQLVWNEADGPSLPVWIPIATAKPKYHGLLCAPINYGDRRLGILSVDREKRESFPQVEYDVLIALAQTIGMALGNEHFRKALKSQPSAGR
jgi:GAF domain-containing protein